MLPLKAKPVPLALMPAWPDVNTAAPGVRNHDCAGSEVVFLWLCSVGNWGSWGYLWMGFGQGGGFRNLTERIHQELVTADSAPVTGPIILDFSIYLLPSLAVSVKQYCDCMFGVIC